MNYLYLNNSPQQPVPRSFVFNKRNEKIDWRRIAAVDVERVARELDFQVLQDNIEHITLCNIDLEVDSRAMDPNFLKLYKMAQLTIEYLLLCQDQITSQLVDYEQNKGKGLADQDETRRQIEKLKNDLNLTKKESKKRKKMIETQEKMLLAQRSNYHTCPVCTHSFLSLDYLQAHMHRRHPEYDPNRKREHDVDIEKEIQRLKDELHSKETELQLIKVQKAVDEEKIRDRDETIRQLKDEIQALTTKITILDEKYFTLRSTNQNQTPSPSRREGGVKELLKENKTLRVENEQLKQLLQQLETNLQKEEKSKRRLERENQNLQKKIVDLNNTLESLQNASGDTSRLSQELIASQNRYNEEKNRRKQLEKEVDEANHQLAQLRNQPPPVIDRKSPAPPPRSTASPSPRSSVSPPPVRVPPRPVQTTEIFLPQYCPSLVRQINENPRFLNQYRDAAKEQLIEEFSQYDNLGITEKDTRLSTNDFPAKMKIVEQTRNNIQQDLPNFERIRAELSQKLDKLANERMHNQQPTTTSSVRSSGGKLVKFEDETQRQPTNSSKRPATAVTTTTIQSKPKSNQKHPAPRFASDDEKTNTHSNDSDEYSQPSRSAVTNDIQPSPRKNLPSTGVSALASGSMRPSITNNTKTVSAIVRPQTAIHKYESEESSDSDNLMEANVATKTRVLDQKLNEISSRGQKTTVGAIAQGFQPSRQTVATHNDNEDDESDPSLTSIDDTNPQPKISNTHGIRELANHHHQNLSSGDVSQYTYDSIWKSPAGKGTEIRRPLTADSAKTSNVDSDNNFDEDDSN
ncbi:unnamed protein product [Adineta steineri]|uniref:C2H2-type domain-containing protein n=2 Tax=Adineta steineri TaxID=433720 RepID=A0A814EHF6_9BILA|nr:unnamed protein product [Adineta steineri]